MRVLSTILLVCCLGFVPCLHGQTPLLYQVETIGSEEFDLVSEEGMPTLYFLSEGKVYKRKAMTASGSMWDLHTPVIEENISAIKTISGDTYTSILYVDDTDVLKYLRTTDASRSTYSEPIVIDQKIMGSHHIDMVHIDGLPHISCFDRKREVLIYSRMLSTETKKWSKPITIDKSGASGEYVDLEVISGLPSVAYYNFGTGRLMFAQAKNKLGSSWNRARVVDDSEDAGLHVSLAVVDNKPTITYWDAVDYSLKHVVSGDKKGTSWEQPITLDDQFTGWHSSINQISDKAVITYYSMKEKSLSMMILEGNNPNSIESYPSITEEGQGMHNVSIPQDNGLAMAYYDNNEKKIVYGYIDFDPERKVDLSASVSSEGLEIIPDFYLGQDTKASLEISTIDEKWEKVSDLDRVEQPLLVSYNPKWGASFNTRIKVKNEKTGESWVSSPKLVSLSTPTDNISDYDNPSSSRSFQLALYNNKGSSSTISIYDENYELVYMQQYSTGKMPKQWKRTIPLEIGKTFYLTLELGDKIYHDKITFSKEGSELEDITASSRKP